MGAGSVTARCGQAAALPQAVCTTALAHDTHIVCTCGARGGGGLRPFFPGRLGHSARPPVSPHLVSLRLLLCLLGSSSRRCRRGGDQIDCAIWVGHYPHLARAHHAGGGAVTRGARGSCSSIGQQGVAGGAGSAGGGGEVLALGRRAARGRGACTGGQGVHAPAVDAPACRGCSGPGLSSTTRGACETQGLGQLTLVGCLLWRRRAVPAQQHVHQAVNHLQEGRRHLLGRLAGCSGVPSGKWAWHGVAVRSGRQGGRTGCDRAGSRQDVGRTRGKRAAGAAGMPASSPTWLLRGQGEQSFKKRSPVFGGAGVTASWPGGGGEEPSAPPAPCRAAVAGCCAGVAAAAPAAGAGVASALGLAPGLASPLAPAGAAAAAAAAASPAPAICDAAPAAGFFFSTTVGRLTATPPESAICADSRACG